MPKKQFKAESKRLLELMINSIYTHKEIFLRELISNASDAMDKRYYSSLSGGETGLAREELFIEVRPDKNARTLTISDRGCGMNKEELEQNLGTIAKSGSLAFKEENGAAEEVSFGMSRELREGAFLRLKAVPVRGVVDWAEVQYDELPPAVQRYYAPPEAGPSLPAE